MTVRDLSCISLLTLLLTACVLGWLEPEPHAIVDLW